MNSFTVFSSLLFLSVIQTSSPYPFHASCNIDWTFGIECSAVATKIQQQIKIWNNDECGSGEKCLYKSVSYEDNVLKATHTTPKKGYVDNLTFTFMEEGTSCSVKGFSTSKTWYALLDYGTNYCNLHNLIEGAGLDKVSGYKETTSDSKCTQYSSHNCEKY